MKKYHWLCILLLYLGLPVPSFAVDGAGENTNLWFLEFQRPSGNENPAKGVIYREFSLTNSRFGIYADLDCESVDYYCQFYTGPTYRLNDWLEVGAALGYGTDPKSLRWNYFVDAKWKDCEAFGTFEGGKAGAWHKATLICAYSERVGVGLMTETYLGTGPRIEYNFTKSSVQVWFSLLRGPGNATVSMVGINRTIDL